MPSLPLAESDVAFFHENGYIRIPQVFSADEMDAMDRELDVLMDQWASTSVGWTGPWRQAYMDKNTEAASKLTAMHDLHFYSEAWCRAVIQPTLTSAAQQLLLGSPVELHHTTLHTKPPQTGHPFPMHQDSPFYRHTDGRYVDVLVHLDDTRHENGEIRFLPGSHKQGHIEHVLKMPNGDDCTPHLPTADWSLEDTVPVPAKRGDVVCFSIFTVHGSYINQTPQPRRMVRVGYRDPANEQMFGQSHNRPGLMVRGVRPKRSGQEAFSTAGAL